MVTTNYTYCYWGLDVRSSYVVLDKMMGKLSSRQRKHYNASSLVATTHRNVDINFPRLFINTLIKVGGSDKGIFVPCIDEKRGSERVQIPKLRQYDIQSKNLEKKIGRYIQTLFEANQFISKKA